LPIYSMTMRFPGRLICIWRVILDGRGKSSKGILGSRIRGYPDAIQPQSWAFTAVSAISKTRRRRE
jgi:hypothetical protein